MFTTTKPTSTTLTRESLKTKERALQHFFTAAMVELTHIYSQPEARTLRHIRQRKKEAMTKLRALLQLARQDVQDTDASASLQLLNIYPFVKAEQLVHQAATEVWGSTAPLQTNHAKAGLIALHQKLLTAWTQVLEHHGHSQDKATQALIVQCKSCHPACSAIWPQVISTITAKLGYPYIRVVAPTLLPDVADEMDAKKDRLVHLSGLYALNGDALPEAEIKEFLTWLNTQKQA